MNFIRHHYRQNLAIIKAIISFLVLLTLMIHNLKKDFIYPDFSVVVACRKSLVVPRKTAATDAVPVSLQRKSHLPQGTAPHLREQNQQL